MKVFETLIVYVLVVMFWTALFYAAYAIVSRMADSSDEMLAQHKKQRATIFSECAQKCLPHAVDFDHTNFQNCFCDVTSQVPAPSPN